MTEEEMIQRYLNKTVHVIYFNGKYQIDTRGKVTKINGNKLYGTWSSDFVVVGSDYISICDDSVGY